MAQEEFSSNTVSRDLAERVKELECLYNISRIATIHKNDLDKALDLIIKEIPHGWQHPESVKAFLQYGDVQIGTKPAKEVSQFTTIQIGLELQGDLYVYFSENSIVPETFLREEQALLNQIGYEISSLIELDIKNKQEKIIQEKLRFSDRLNVLGELTAGIAHELNTPLGNIIGYSELLYKHESDLNKKSDLEKVLKSAKHSREIVKKLMFFSCEMPSQFKKGNINNLVNECLELLKIQLAEKQIRIEKELNEIPQVSLDPVQITQVIFNIVLNAIDAMEINGKLVVKTSVSKKELRISISDDGKGIPDNEIQRLFQPFYTNKGHNGTGLGLAVSHGIMQAHKGNIEVESVVGKGTTFTLIFSIHNE